MQQVFCVTPEERPGGGGLVLVTGGIRTVCLASCFFTEIKTLNPVNKTRHTTVAQAAYGFHEHS